MEDVKEIQVLITNLRDWKQIIKEDFSTFAPNFFFFNLGYYVKPRGR